MNLCLYLVDPLQILLPVWSSCTFVWVGTYSNLISCKTWFFRWQWGNHKGCLNRLIEDICKHMEVKHGGIVELCISHSWACINWLSSLRVVCVPEKERCRWWPGRWWWRWWPVQPHFEAVCPNQFLIPDLHEWMCLPQFPVIQDGNGRNLYEYNCFKSQSCPLWSGSFLLRIHYFLGVSKFADIPDSLKHSQVEQIQIFPEVSTGNSRFCNTRYSISWNTIILHRNTI